MPGTRRTDNPATRANVVKTTKRYKTITDVLNAGLARLEADLVYYRSLLKNRALFDDNQGKIGIAATTKQIAKQKAAIRIDQQENEQALRNGDITKFW